MERESLRPKILLEGGGRAGSADQFSRAASEVSSAHSTGPAVPQGPGAPEANPPVDPASGAVKSGAMIDMQRFVLAQYVCDFGNVIKSNQLSKSFKITNVGHTQISFEFSKALKSAVSGAGFIIEPDRVNRLPGAPDFESVEFNVTFNSSRPGVKVGPLELLVPLQIKGGPQASIASQVTVVQTVLSLSVLEPAGECADEGERHDPGRGPEHGEP